MLGRGDQDPIGVGYHELLGDIRGPGCPVCRGCNMAAWRYIDSLLWEFVNDGGVRARLRRAHGFCREHALLALEVAAEQGAASGIATLYEDFLLHARQEAIAVIGRRPRRLLRTNSAPDPVPLDPHERCPVCESVSRATDNYVRLLGGSEPDSEIGTAARRELRSLRLPHLRRGIELAASHDDAERLLHVYLRGEAELRTDLHEFLRKQSYVHRDEPVSQRERSSWRRAVHLVVGEPPPKRKPLRH